MNLTTQSGTGTFVVGGMLLGAAPRYCTVEPPEANAPNQNDAGRN